MVEMTGSKALMEALRREKVKVIFGMPGGANLPIYDDLYDSGIKHVLVKHEQVGAHMADGYARVSRGPGVCMATSGPGATNLVTGIATAYMDSSPVIAITGQVPKAMIGRDAFQETDVVGVMASITKHTIQPRSAGEVPSAIKSAFYIANSGRPGPVLVDIPKDVQVESDEMIFPEKIEIRGYTPILPIDPVKVAQAAEILAKSERPVIWGGGGIRISDASEPFTAIAELLNAPVVTSLQGKGIFPENHPLCLGPMGMHGRAEANKLIGEADVILAAGVRFSDRTTGTADEFGKSAKIIHIDADPSEINKNKRVHLHLLGDAKEILGQIYKTLTNSFKRKGPGSWLERINEVREEMKQIEAYDTSRSDLIGPNIVRLMREILQPDSSLTTGVGRHQMWCEVHYQVLKPRTWITSTGLGTMGFGLPAAIGAKFAKPDVPVIDFDGDGSFMMTETALAVAVEEKVPIIAIILNDNSLGMVEQGQRIFYKRRYSGVRSTAVPDFVKLAEAYGADGRRVDSLEQFAKTLREGLRSDMPMVIDVPVDSEYDVFPFMAPGKSLKDTVHGPKEMGIF